MKKKMIERIKKAHKIAKNECRWEMKENKNFIFIYPIAYLVCFIFKLL
jgi:hypothetical protein